MMIQQPPPIIIMIVRALVVSMVLLLLLSSTTTTVTAFTSVTTTTTTTIHRSSPVAVSHFRNIHSSHPPFQIKSSTSSSLYNAATTSSITSPLSNPLKQLPWNIQKERIREIRRNQLERSKIFRQIGIAEDATYEEIVYATDQLIQAAGNNIKQKIQIEIMKDQILQHRLNERLNGLLAQERNSSNKEARAMSNYEMEGYVVFLRVLLFFLF
jgi:hypothetical protein